MEVNSLKKGIKRTLIASLSITLLSPLVNNGLVVLAEESQDVVVSSQDERQSGQTTYISESVALTYTDDKELLVHGNVETTQSAKLTLLNTSTEVNGSFEVIVPILSEEIALTIFNQNNEVIEKASFIPEQIITEFGQEVQIDELLDNESLVTEEADNKDTEDLDRLFEVEELLKGEELNNDTQSVTPSSSIQTFSVQSTDNRQHQGGIYYVQKSNNDSFTTIADSFDISMMQLKVWNPQVKDINLIKVGEPLAVTTAGFEEMQSEDVKARMHTGNNPSQFKNVNDFINQMAPKAQKISNQAGEEPLYASLMLAQAIHESGVARSIGESQLARAPYYNLSGIKAGKNTPSVLMWTWESIADDYGEVKDNSRINVRVMADFQKFSSYDESLQRYANLLRYGRGTGEDSYYRGTWVNNTKDVWEVLEKGGLRGYATDPAYFSAIKNTIEKYDLTQFDNNNRLSGDDRFDTAVSISQKGWGKTDTVIIANGFEYADALAGAPLAAMNNSPILLTKQNSISSDTLKEIKRLGARKAIILGGEAAVSKQVESILTKEKVSVERIGGDDRYETAALIANAVKTERISNGLGLPTEGILVSGQDFSDAMSVAPFAAEKGLPIYLTKTDSLPSATATGIKDLSNWTIIGGPAAVTENVYNKVNKLNITTKRLFGDDRYETNRKVISNYSAKNEVVYIATGTDFADALTGSVLAGKDKTSILLVNDKKTMITDQVNFAKKQGYTNPFLIGGEHSISRTVQDTFNTLSH